MRTTINRKEPEIKNCSNCKHYQICFIRRDVVDLVYGESATFTGNDKGHPALLNDLFAAFADKCTQYHKKTA